MRQGQSTNYLTERLVLHELPNQVDEAVGKLQPQAILPGNSSTDFAMQDLIERGRLVVGLAEEVDLRIQSSVLPARQKADCTTSLDESEQLQYSSHDRPPYVNKCAIQ
jgi:hypothetical protein